jgi:hypothetical protein
MQKHKGSCPPSTVWDLRIGRQNELLASLDQPAARDGPGVLDIFDGPA